MADSQSTGLRQRNVSKSPKTSPAAELTADDVGTRPKKEQIVWGKTPGGEVFRVPTTYDVLTALFHPGYPKSHIDLLNLFLLGSQIALFFALPRGVAQPFFLAYFAFWRAAYDAGLGWVLTRQSKRRWIVKEVQRRGWLDGERRPRVRAWIRKQLQGKMGGDYSFDDLPLEYNTWLLFRQMVDIILLNDFVAYCMFAFACFRVPNGLSMTMHAMRWLGGLALIAFNLWVKTEAHHVVKDYGWYWGDVFFQRGALVFDGVFELAPHPMYSVGYAGYYGLSLIVGSYPVLFASLAAHAAQFGFLVWFENPHIERTYGQKKPLAQRTPLVHRRAASELSLSSSGKGAESPPSSTAPTPSATEGETATDTTDLETETETEYEDAHVAIRRPPALKSSASLRMERPHGRPRSPPMTQHDLLNSYFRKDTIFLHNFDFLRASDFKLLLVIVYALGSAFVPPLTRNGTLTLHFLHALGWTLFHSFGLGLLLRGQSQSKFLVRHFLKHYHYPSGDGGKGAIQEAFWNWKSMYNLSLCMSYVSFVGLVWKTYSIPVDWTVGDELLRHTLGALLIGLNVWALMESYEVLGVFGWFFGDFFMEDFPAHLEYTGIYRYVNNPEIMSGAAFFGLALISGSKLVYALAVVRTLAHWWFLRNVENPHMRKLYGESLRPEAGFVKVIRKAAAKNAARLLDSPAGAKHGREIRRVAKEVRGTFEKVYEETAEAVEEFLAKSTPRISEVMQDTKIMLQQSRERLVITRVSRDLSSFDQSKYKISIVSAQPDGALRFHLGEPIKVKWQAPVAHSRRDWMGIYRVGANQSKLVTKTSSLGMWVPVHDEEWDGDVPIGANKRSTSPGKDSEKGYVEFKSGTLPWQVGKYEIRYHHDGKYNVMSSDGPFEVYVDTPASLDFQSVRTSLMRIVTLCLDSDPSLIPLSCSGAEEEGRDPDDFRFWSERQARRISTAVKQAFDVECAPEVIVADANLSALANRILVSKEILSPGAAGAQ